MGHDLSQHVSVGTDFVMPSVLAAAHELKAPLVLMRQLSLQLAMDGTASSPEARRAHERMRMTAERTLRLVDNITRASRLQDGLFDMEPLQVASVWHSVLDEVHPLARSMEQTLEVAVPSRPLLVLGHRELLPAVLMGLCDNAVGHTGRGGAVKVSARARGHEIEFSVRDQGPVISNKAFENLKTRLGRSPQPLGSRSTSSGLGLWIAGEFARSMSSRLEVTRHRGGGMTFSLLVPTSRQLSLL